MKVPFLVWHGLAQSGDVWREGFPKADWRGVRAVILSEAKDLSARRARPFASLRVTGILSKYLPSPLRT
jgi:hypothetical protein